MQKSIRSKLGLIFASLVLAVGLLMTGIGISAEGYNPYYGGWNNCTWSAWQLAYNATGISLPGMGNAVSWYGNAAAYGYSVGTTPRANSIAVWGGGLGHVGFVSAVDETGAIYVQEGNYAGRYHEQWWSSGYRDSKPFIGYIYLDSSASNIVSTESHTEVLKTSTVVTQQISQEEIRRHAEEEARRLEEEKKLQAEKEEMERREKLVEEEANTVTVVEDAVEVEKEVMKKEEKDAIEDVKEEATMVTITSVDSSDN